MNQSFFVFAITACLVISGCGTEYDSARVASVASSKLVAAEKSVDEEVALNAQASDVGEGEGSAARQRKIIYNTTVGLVVDSYRDFEQKIGGLVNQHDGFVSSSRTDRRYNDRQSGTWTIRVPVSKYSSFLDGVTGLGFAESREENAEDVTEEYVDVEARITNKKQLESRVLELLEKQSGKLADVLEIERELSRVREEIERMEGRLRYLKNRTSLATVTIEVREESEYVPPESPTFLTRARSAWDFSVDNLKSLAQFALISLIAFVPWLVAFWIPLFVVLRFVWRRWKRRTTQA